MPRTLDLSAEAPWRRRLKAPSLTVAALAAGRPERGLVRTNAATSKAQLCAWDVASGALRPLTDEPHGVSYGWLTPDGERAIFLRDERGSEIGHLAAVPYAGGPPRDLTPELPPYTLRGLDISRDGSTLAFDAVGDGVYRFYLLDLAGGGPARLLYESAFETWESILSHGAELLAVKSSERAGGRRRYSTRVLDTASGALVGELWDGPEESVEPIAFSPVAGDMRLLLSTTRYGGFVRPVVWEPRSGERRDLELAEVEGELAPLDWSPDGARLLLLQTHRAERRLYTYDLGAGKLTRLDHPAGVVLGKGGPYHCGTSGSFFRPDGSIIAVWQDSATPSRVLALSGETGALEATLLAPAEAPPGTPLRSVEFRSSDGTPVQGWLGVPAGEGPFPTVLYVHGGPHGYTAELFDPWAQAWLEHGFAFLTINYRGSTGFGRAFREQIDGDVGHWELEDMVAARQWLVDQGIARPDAVLLEGGSYGGYLTVWALGRRPELWAGGMAPAPLLDWTINYEDSSDALRGWARALHGGPPDALPALYRERSAATYAAAIRAPLIISQGRSDSRTPPRQVEVFAETMAELDKDLEVVWLEGGHSFAGGLEALVERHLRFAYRVLG
jgi:dipeptidyl aminopeptidase/acylaminoacyl peptidase